MDVRFRGLGLKLKSCGKVVLHGVTGELTHGRLTAIMGPSGELRCACAAGQASAGAQLLNTGVSTSVLAGDRGTTGCSSDRVLPCSRVSAGAGKSSLITALAGRAHYATMTGTVLIGGRWARLMHEAPRTDSKTLLKHSELLPPRTVPHLYGRPDSLSRHRRRMGFVPQADTMYRQLTVEENLTFSCSFR
jgi:ABC-type multidrug transport system ATPase subunit